MLPMKHRSTNVRTRAKRSTDKRSTHRLAHLLSSCLLTLCCSLPCAGRPLDLNNDNGYALKLFSVPTLASQEFALPRSQTDALLKRRTPSLPIVAGKGGTPEETGLNGRMRRARLHRRAPLLPLEQASKGGKELVDKAVGGASSEHPPITNVDIGKQLERKHKGPFRRLPDGVGSARTLARQKERAKLRRQGVIAFAPSGAPHQPLQGSSIASGSSAPQTFPDAPAKDLPAVHRPLKYRWGEGSTATLYRQKKELIKQGRVDEVEKLIGDPRLSKQAATHNQGLSGGQISKARQKMRVQKKTEIEIWTRYPGDPRSAGTRVRQKLLEELSRAGPEHQHLWPVGTPETQAARRTHDRNKLRAEGLSDTEVWQRVPKKVGQGRKAADQKSRGGGARRDPTVAGPELGVGPGKWTRPTPLSRDAAPPAPPAKTITTRKPESIAIPEAGPVTPSSVPTRRKRPLPFDLNLPPSPASPH
ncbi:hypothetical protein IE81DRAFT_32315 [Ceraceosorus guamensis]|uniref:Uncharacterized protein n=1 Tax=Ceraceosorus guamensis TaxID=1522189 RepID=A0A316VPY3_9BASI|nr:hypothetical protein IE81DRAFT_32315 [Ceraceosorus guamensis]PWN39390.1 hypothetical protein IE81DRAFT_32315 [Ceraceosorus guamensis]